MSFYTNLQSKAKSLLTKFGRDVTVRRVTVGAYDTATAQQAIVTNDFVFKGALFDFADGVTQFNGELVQMTDKRLLLEGAAAPAVKDAILIDDVEYSIVSMKEINPAGTSVIFEVHLRR